MKKLLFILAAVFCLASCEEDTIGPTFDPGSVSGGTTGGNTGGGTSTGVITPIANFDYEIQHPFTVVLTNKSSSAESYEWTFGDGTRDSSKNPTHMYASKGVYKITLTVKSKTGHPATISKNVTLENPTKIYMNAVTYRKIPVQNEYYRIMVLDDDFFTTTWVTTAWTMLSSANLPYFYEFREPIIMDGLAADEYYTMKVYYNSKTTGNGTECAAFKFLTTDIYKFPTKMDFKNDKCEATLHFIYK